MALDGRTENKVALVTGGARASAARSHCDLRRTVPTSRSSTSTRPRPQPSPTRSANWAATRPVSSPTSPIATRSTRLSTRESALSGFDIMVNNAGIAQVNAIADVRPEEVRTILGVNLEGVLWGIQARPPSSLRAPPPPRRNRDHQREDHQCRLHRRPRRVRHARRVLRDQVRGPGIDPGSGERVCGGGITVNAYCPGVVGTDMWVTIDERFAALTGAAKGETYDKFVGGIALGRAETPEDVAGYVSYLAGPDSDYMTGQAGLIDGGLVYR